MTDNEEMERLAFDEMRTAEAVMYASARRFCKAFEALEIPAEDREVYGPWDAGYDVVEASNRWAEAQKRFHAYHDHETSE